MATQPRLLLEEARRLASRLRPRLGGGFRGLRRRGRRRSRRSAARTRPALVRATAWAGALTVLALLMPLLLVETRPQQRAASPGSERTAPVAPDVAPPEAGAAEQVRVYLSGTRQVERVALEQYVRGVIAAEMPSDFELEALKAQAIAARTYIVRRLLAQDASGAPEGADVTDTVAHQAYVPLAELERRPQDAVAKLNRAVNETKDIVLTYKGEPIMAAFFSTSNGYTENAEDYWTNPVPYLKSVSSPWDQAISPRYTEQVEMEVSTVLAKLGLSANAVPALSRLLDSSNGTNHTPPEPSKHDSKLSAAAFSKDIRILSHTPGERVEHVRIGTHQFTGREIREKLDLRSSAFEWKMEGDKVLITTFGFGHGVGMSQYGAQGMAKEGASAEKIVTYYYKGVSLDKASKLLTLNLKN
ncbi:SpoIID/LytB domain-containing protein [Paenibacillus sp. OSY-SE]|uniref:SpoIID/LytB domain-containing protein n=1 Tax=Paenibacillus sp. OSY-SE TaxID=1196323 RepID=UPI000474FD97|nr:SpoIID/LytB domain-containing protein [Paenibacillus sp. OSY-SE]